MDLRDWLFYLFYCFILASAFLVVYAVALRAAGAY